MKFSELRTAVRDWIESKIRIDEWSLDSPSKLVTVINNVKYPANVAIEAPIKDVFMPDNAAVSLGQKTISVVLPYAVQYRFSAQTRLYSLPTVALSSLYMSVLTDWLVNGAEINEDILSVGTTSIVESPIAISRIDETASDWLVTLFFEFEVNCLFEPEQVPDIQPNNPDWIPPVSRPVTVQWGIWRSAIDGLGDQTESFKDGEIEILPP